MSIGQNGLDYYIKREPRLYDGTSFFKSFPIPTSLSQEDTQGLRRNQYTLSVSGNHCPNVAQHIQLSAHHNREGYLTTATGALHSVEAGIAQREKYPGPETVDRLDFGYWLGSNSNKRFTVIFNETAQAGYRIEPPNVKIDETETLAALAVLDRIVSFVPTPIES